MRDIAITAIVLGLLPVTLFRPWIGFLLWTWISTMVPHRQTFGFAYDMNFAFMVGATLLVGFLITRDKKPIPWNTQTVLILLMLIHFGITSIFAWSQESALDRYKDFFKEILMVFVGTTLIYGHKRIKYLIVVIVFSIGFYGFKGGLFTLVTGGGERVNGPDDSFIAGNTFIGRIGILNALFHQPARYPCDGRTVNRVTIHSSPAVFPGILPVAASDFPQSARRHERKPSPPIGSGQNQSGVCESSRLK